MSLQNKTRARRPLGARGRLYDWFHNKLLAEWLCVGAVLLFAHISFLYSDLTDTYENSVLFLRAIAQGRLTDFYSYSVENVRTLWAANYDSMIYVVYGLWNLPVYLLTKLLGIDYLAWAPGILWCKTLGTLLCLVIARYIYKILFYVGTPKRFCLLGSFLYLSSTALYLSVFVIAQVDSFAILLLVIGFYCYLKEEYGRFFLCFLIAMPCKMFAALMFLPLLLLVEKRIVMAGIKTALVFSLSMLSGLLFRGDPAYGFAVGSQSRDGVLRLLEGELFWGQNVIPFFIAYMGICLFCYLYDGYRKNRKEYQIPVYCVMFMWASFVCFVYINAYWVYFLLPFLAIGIVACGRFQKVCFLLELAFSVGYLGYVLIYCKVLWDPNLINTLLLPKFWPLPPEEHLKYGTLMPLVSGLGWDRYGALLSTIMAASLIFLMVLTCPFLFKQAARYEKVERAVLWGRIGCMAGVTCLILYAFLKTEPPVICTTLTAPGVVCDTDLIEGPGWIGQEIQVDQEEHPEQLSLYFDNAYYVRSNFTSVLVEIGETETGACIFETRIGGSMIEPGKRQDIKLKDVTLEAGKTYLIKITGVPGTAENRKSGIRLYPWITEGLADAEHPALVNGVQQNYNLYFQIR